jgi:GNAT superfamily N-acetyltransferase/acyl carrier protein
MDAGARGEQRGTWVDTADIRKAVLETIASIAPETDPQHIRCDQPLRRQVDLDSMDWLNVLAGVQQRLSIAIADADAGRLTTVDEIVACLASRQAQPFEPPQPAAAGELPASRHMIGTTAVTLRPIRPDDLPLEADFVRRLSAETRYQRFLVTVNELSDRKLHYFTEVDQVRHVALVAAVERDGRPAIVGVARYIVAPAGDGCEFAVAVDDSWQGTGLAGILMKALIGVARARGLATMEGTVLATNTRMLKFTRQLGFSRQRHPEDRETVRVVRRL